MKIVKLENGNVELRTDSDVWITTLEASAKIRKSHLDTKLAIIQQNDRIDHITVSEVTATQVEPNAEIAFSGSIIDLANLLSQDFFFEVSSGGAPFNNYKAGTWTAFEEAYSLRFSGTALDADKLYGRVVEIRQTCTLSEAGLRITTLSAGSAVVGLYKYDESLDSWSLIVQTPSGSPFDTGVAAPAFIAFDSPVQVEPGIYAICILSNATPNMYHLRYEASSTYFGSSVTISTTDYFPAVSVVLAYTATLPPNPALVPASESHIPEIILKIDS